MEHAKSLTTVPASIIYTYPVALRNPLDFNQITLSFGRHFILPPVRLHDHDGNPDATGRQILSSIFLRRLDDALIDRDALETIISASGGLIGTLLRLGQWAAEQALVDGKTVIDVDSAERAIAEMRGDFKTLLRRQDYEVLRQQLDQQELTNEEAVREALYTGCLLDEYEADPEADQAAIAGLLGKLASIWYFSDRFDQVEAAQRRRLDIARQLGDRHLEADSRLQIGLIRQFHADLAAADEQYRAALADFQAIGDRLGTANTYFGLDELARTSLQFDQAARFYEKALVEQRAIGDRLGQANTIDSMGELAEAQEHWQAARDFYAAALRIYRAIGDSFANVTARNLARVEARLAGSAIPDETQQARERLLSQWQPVIQAVVAAARGDQQALQQVSAFLHQMSGSPDWERLASALQQLVGGERDAAVLANGLEETDRVILAATLTSMG